MSDCASRMANHHVATVPESLERAPIEVRAPIGERSVTPEHAAYRALAVRDRNTDFAAPGIKSVKAEGLFVGRAGMCKGCACTRRRGDGGEGGRGNFFPYVVI